MKKGIVFLVLVLFFRGTLMAQQPEIYLIGVPSFDYDIVIEASFLPYLEVMNNLATQNDLQIKVQQSFRKIGGNISGAIVPPADRSNHLVGHALDINIVHNGIWYNSSKLALENWDNLPQAIRNFISGCESAGIRWGGRFSTPDPVHFDSGINVRDQRWYDGWLGALQRLYVKEYEREPHK